MQLFLPDESEMLPLFFRYQGQNEPQPAYLEIDLQDGVAEFRWSYELNGWTTIAEGVHRLNCPATLTGRELHELADELLPLLETLKAADVDDDEDIVQALLRQIKEMIWAREPNCDVLAAEEWLAPALQCERDKNGTLLAVAVLGGHLKSGH